LPQIFITIEMQNIRNKILKEDDDYDNKELSTGKPDLPFVHGKD